MLQRSWMLHSYPVSYTHLEKLSELRQISIHYAEKGDLVYPVLKVRYEISGPSDVMWTVDDEIRDELAALEDVYKRQRSPHNNPDARAMFIGMSMDTTREEMTQAVLEGVAFGLRDSLELSLIHISWWFWKTS